jgi:hypothetical protein
MQPNIIKAFKELATYLGGKFDALSLSIKNNPQNIRIDMGDATKKMEHVAHSTSELLSGLEAFVKSEKVSREQTLEIISAVQQTVEAQSRALTSTDSNGKLEEIRKALVSIEGAVGKKSFDYSEQKKTNKLLADMIRAVGSISLEERDVDFSSVERAIKDIKIPEKVYIEPDFYEKMNALLKAVANIKLPSTFKLDDMQYRALATPSVTVAGGGGMPSATKVTMANLAMPNADTQYAYSFPANTLSWELKLRAPNTILYYSFIDGTLKESGDGSLYGTIPQSFFRSHDGVEWSGKTIYLEHGSASAQVAEITVYTL